MKHFEVLFAISLMYAVGTNAFQASINQRPSSVLVADNLRGLPSQRRVVLLLAEGNPEDSEIVGKRITVTGDVQGGYYRSCVANEVRRQDGSNQQQKIK